MRWMLDAAGGRVLAISFLTAAALSAGVVAVVRIRTGGDVDNVWSWMWAVAYLTVGSIGLIVVLVSI